MTNEPNNQAKIWVRNDYNRKLTSGIVSLSGFSLQWKTPSPPRNCAHCSRSQSVMFIPRRRELFKKKQLGNRKWRPMSRLGGASPGGSPLWFQLGSEERDTPPPGWPSTCGHTFILRLLPASQEPSQCSTVLFIVPCVLWVWKIIHSCPIKSRLAMGPALARKTGAAKQKH